MSRRKQANPQHVHDPPELVEKGNCAVAVANEVPVDKKLLLSCDPSAEINKNTLQSESWAKQSTQSSQCSEPMSMDNNTTEPSNLTSLGKKEALPTNLFLFPASLSNGYSMSDPVQYTPERTCEKTSSVVSIKGNMKAENENSKSCFPSCCNEDAREDTGCSTADLCQENKSMNPSENEPEKCHDYVEDADVQNNDEEIKPIDTPVEDNEPCSVEMTSPCDDVTKRGTSDEPKFSLHEKETEEERIENSHAKENTDSVDLNTNNNTTNTVNNDDMQLSVDDEKENFNTQSMIESFTRSQQLLFNSKFDKDTNDESKELNEIKDQMRMLQQQQAYQVQMLNYLHVQLTLLASNPQAQKALTTMFQSPGLNRQQLPSMPQFLSSSIGGNSRPPTSGFLPSMAAALGRQLSTGKPSELPQNFEILNGFGQVINENGTQQMESISEGNTEPYNPLSSLAMLQNSSAMRANGGELFDNLSSNNLREHHDEAFSKHACRFCQKVFGSDSALQIHLRSHTGERPFKCNICANRFSTKGNLKVHFVRHKEKYPNIEMNPNPVPEYLDNIPTSSGIQYGMSVLPDESDSNRQESDAADDRNSFNNNLNRSRVDLPAPYESVDALDMSVNDEREQKENVSEDDRSNQSTTVEDSSTLKARSESENDDRKPLLKGSILSMFPFANAALREAQAKAVADFLPQMSSASSVSTENQSRKAWEDFPNQGNAPMTKTLGTSSSETTKLQQLVEQIDRTKELEKNECHICHRVLSCQSALKLHYRTHTGERPYKCDLCSRAFTTRGNLRTHYSSVHRQQLRNSPPQNTQTTRGSALQCPLCGSRFMNQQSIQQHMQMHIYMHNQQQAQMMNGQTPPVDYRMMGVMGSGFPPASSIAPEKDSQDAEIKTEQTLAENDDVFEDNVSETNCSPKAQDHTLEESKEDLDKDALMFSQPAISRESMSGCLQNDDSSQESSATQDLEKSENAALDLSRPGSHSSSSVADARAISPSSHKYDAASSTPSPTSTTCSSLSALASLASNGSIMRPNGLSMINSQMASVKEEARARKMTTSCEICNKPFTCHSALEIHLRSHTKERPFVCRVCERRFTTKGNLKQHLLTHNITDVDDEMLEPVFSPSNGKSSPCSPSNSPSLSESAYPTKRPLEASQSAPPAKRSYPRHWCHICQKQFSSASSLQIHNRTHTGEKPFACSVCGRAFTTKGNLKVHMGTHVWGAGGSRRGRRISMDNPLISPWMQNTSAANATNPPLRPRVPPQVTAVPDHAAIYQQYAALASGIIGAKAAADARFHGNPMMNFNNAAVRLLMPNNLSQNPAIPASDEKVLDPGLKESNNKSMAAAATEWIWKAYQQTQEQVN